MWMNAVDSNHGPRVIGATGVFAIAAGAMISSGIFVLPSAAFARTGPAVVLSYGIAGLVALLGTLAVIELATGMPKAGGDYYFITRSLGPLVGTISGLLSWFALSAKSAFAVYGLSALLATIVPMPQWVLSLALVLLFVLANLAGAKSAAALEVGLVAALVAILVGFASVGLPRVDPNAFRPFVTTSGNGRWNLVASTVGFVFVSFGGLINAASVSGEVKKPARSLPVGFLAAIGTVTVLYVVSLVVTVGVLPAEELTGSAAPLAATAAVLIGRPGYLALAVAAALAFVTTAHAGILSASRYPPALAHDRLMPAFLGRTTRHGVPLPSLLLTGALVAGAGVVRLEMLVTAASTIILSSYFLANLAGLVMRYSGLTGYRPTFRVPLTPVPQIAAMVLFVFFVIDLGLTGVAVAAALVTVSLAVYLLYGKRLHAGEYALLHVLERITNRELTSTNLERELRMIVHETENVVHDRVDGVIAEALVLDLPDIADRHDLFTAISQELAPRINLPPEEISRLLNERETDGTTALSDFVAVPHLVVPVPNSFALACVRVTSGVRFSDDSPAVKAVFVLAGSADQRTLHLRTLAAVAQIATDDRFETEWLGARKPEQLREVLLLSARRRHQGR